MSDAAEIRKRRIYRVTLVGFAVNLVLSLAKLAAGVFGRSGAMVADAVHSFSDLATDVVVIVFARISAKPRDDGHDYGHGKYETLATILISMALGVVGVGILVNSIGAVRSVLDGGVLPRPGLVALVAAVLSIAAKEILYRYTVREGRAIDSPSVVANAWHHRSDAFSSIATLLGIGAARAFGGKWVIMDPVAAIVVGALIVKISIELVIPNLGDLLEKRLPASEEHRILEMISSISGIQDPHRLRARNLGTRIAVEMSIRLSPDMTVDASHLVTAEIEELLRREYGPETQVTVNVEPFRPIRWK